MELYFFRTVRVATVDHSEGTDEPGYALQVLGDKWRTVDECSGGHLFGIGSRVARPMRFVLRQFVGKGLWTMSSTPEQATLAEADMALRRFYHGVVPVLEKASAAVGEAVTESCLDNFTDADFDALR
jgi:hypothetical protein